MTLTKPKRPGFDKLNLNINEELLKDIRKECNHFGSIHEVDLISQELIQNKTASKFVTNAKSTWWWENLIKEPDFLSSYSGDGPFKEISSLLTDLLEEPAYLAVTDDNSPPWPIFHGNTRELIELLQNCWTFEYFLVSESYEWILFDTHHDMLIGVGVAA